VSQRAPSTLRELAQARGVDERHARGAIAEEILEAVREGKAAPAPDAPKGNDDLDRNLRPAVALITAWVGQLARDERIDTALLATRADIVALLRGDDGARLAEGWRGRLLGDGIRRLVNGQAGLTFDGEGRLELVPVRD
jgi:ribonuclease D